MAPVLMKNGGHVTGYVLDDSVSDEVISKLESLCDKDLINLKGSKYVLSDLNNIFLKVKEDLDKKKMGLE